MEICPHLRSFSAGQSNLTAQLASARSGQLSGELWPSATFIFFFLKNEFSAIL